MAVVLSTGVRCADTELICTHSSKNGVIMGVTMKYDLFQSEFLTFA